GTNTAVGTSTLTISTASYVGIGTTSPASLLEISGTDTGTTATTFTPATTLSIGNRSTTNNTIATLAFRTQDATNGVASSSAQIVSINSSHTATKISGILSFQTNNAGSLTEKMRITAAGLVGIATNAPGSYLTINPATPAAGTANLNATQLVQIVGGAGGDNTANTGTVFAGNGGAIVINSGAGGSITGTPTSGFGGTGGNISFIAGAGGAGGGTTPFGGSAGTISFTAGAAASNAGAVGGDVTIGGGSASLSTAFAGSVYIAGGNASTNAATGNVILGVSISGGTPRGRVGVGTTTPWALFSIDPETTNLAGGTPEFVIGSSSATHLIVTQAGKVGIGTTSPAAQLTTTGTVQFANYGSAGATVTTDANGNLSVSSDERLKDINGSFNRGLAEIEQLSPILYHWNATSGLDQKGQYAGFSAQNVKSVIPEAVATDSRGYLTLADRPIIAASVNAIKELAGRTDTLATSSASFTAQLQTLNTAFAQNQTNLALPHALTATTLTAESLSIAQGISSGSLTAQSVNAAGTISAARYTVPAEANVFTFGSSTMSTVLPQEALTDNGSVDIYKLASYGVARVQALAERTDLLSIKIDDIESRLAAIEVLTGSSSTDPVNIVGTTLTNILSSLGVVMKDGLAMFNNLITHQLTLVGGTDGTASTGSVTMPSGSTSIVVTNALVHPSSKIFLTFTSSVDGSWYLSEKKEGSFTVMLSKPQTSDTAFDYFLIQTDPHAQVAAAGQANQPATPPPGSSEATTTPPTVSQDGGPTVSLVGDAAAQVVQGGAWTDPGATAAAADGTSLTADIVVTGTVDVQTPGLYTITYRATDAGGKIGQASRVVTVLAPVSGASDPAVTATPPADSGPTAGADAGTPAS
ncbi:MAG: hypothetical protein JWL75_521, partial [Parcubacteria group bacterium]|nr:hypothetical protein [Parcubacteria group bacterium]